MGNVITLKVVYPPIHAPTFFSNRNAFRRNATRGQGNTERFTSFLGTHFRYLYVPRSARYIRRGAVRLRLDIQKGFKRGKFFNAKRVKKASYFPTNDFHDGLSSVSHARGEVSARAIYTVMLDTTFANDMRVPRQDTIPLIRLGTSRGMISAQRGQGKFFTGVFIRVNLAVVRRSNGFVLRSFFEGLYRVGRRLVIATSHPSFPHNSIAQRRITRFQVFFFRRVPQLPIPWYGRPPTLAANNLARGRPFFTRFSHNEIMLSRFGVYRQGTRARRFYNSFSNVNGETNHVARWTVRPTYNGRSNVTCGPRRFTDVNILRYTTATSIPKGRRNTRLVI